MGIKHSYGKARAKVFVELITRFLESLMNKSLGRSTECKRQMELIPSYLASVKPGEEKHYDLTFFAVLRKQDLGSVNKDPGNKGRILLVCKSEVHFPCT